MMNKQAQFQDFLNRLKKGERVKYTFHIDWDWYEAHRQFELVNKDWIEGVTERFIDGDDGRSWISFEWCYDDGYFFCCYRESDIDEKELCASSMNEEELRSFFKILE